MEISLISKANSLRVQFCERYPNVQKKKTSIYFNFHNLLHFNKRKWQNEMFTIKMQFLFFEISYGLEYH